MIFVGIVCKDERDLPQSVAHQVFFDTIFVKGLGRGLIGRVGSLRQAVLNKGDHNFIMGGLVMKKWIFIGVGVLVVIIAVVLIVGALKLGPIIKTAVNTYGPGITKTDMRLSDVDVSILSAKAELKGFYLGNPKGFTSPQAMSVGGIYLDVDEGSLTGDTIIIDKIEVVSPQITYEKKKGTDNFQTILNNVTQKVGSEKPVKEEPAQKKEAGKKLLIKNFILRDGSVNLVVPLLKGKSVSAPLPDIHLKDIGKGKEGASPAQVAKEIFAALYEKITSPSVTDNLNNMLKTLGPDVKAIGEDVKKKLEDAKEDVTKQLEEKTEDIKKQLEGSKEAQEGIKDVTDKLKGFLNK